MAEKFTSKPVTIEAMQWDGTTRSADVIITWMTKHGGRVDFYETNETQHRQHAELHIHTLEGVMTQKPSDWTIKGTINEFYPCRDEVFRHKYEGNFDAEIAF